MCCRAVGPVQVNRERLTVGTAASLNLSAAEKSAFRAWNSNKTAVNKAAWNSILEQEQPAVVKAFRNALDGSPRVKQIMDPWLMDVDSLDATAGTPNPHFRENEQLHWDHLHITIHEPKILGD